ncbi:glycosyltransferase family 4 protein [Roseofilum sp. Guam]|uniref:glycosyltransferase family 4 protein n=1 Tax=Roseofilum sp. Guam TaxID=2821502 RepID=UPI001B1715C0|nr:glycosyltransferase family 4 protein [Roseofilum sp. Guam]MBP0028071.1 glycosyltransferase family 4 protein [Roseofilum sp. Guam]
MKITLLSRGDSGAGGYVAVYRLYQGLKRVEDRTTLLVGSAKKSDTTSLNTSPFDKVFSQLGPTLDKLPLKRYTDRPSTLFSTQWVPDRIVAKLKRIEPDIVNVHWISQGFMQIGTLAKLPYPLVWTSHDMWGFTGGCHYTQECDRYIQQCGKCPQLKSSKEQDLSRWIWQRKKRAWSAIPLTLITPSHWLADCMKKSSLFQDKRIEVIANGLDTTVYKPCDRVSDAEHYRGYARDRLNLPQDKHLVLFGAVNATSDTRKGFHLLQPALQHLSQCHQQDNIELVIFGASRPQEEPALGFKTHYLGKFQDDLALSLIYAAVDLFVAPSIQDNLPNTILESLACGTPAVAFNIGGMPDMIEHQQNGYLAQAFEIKDLAQGIRWVLEDKERYQNLCDRACQKVEQEFTLEIQADNYLNLFAEIIDNYHKEYR